MPYMIIIGPPLFLYILVGNIVLYEAVTFLHLLPLSASDYFKFLRICWSSSVSSFHHYLVDLSLLVLKSLYYVSLVNKVQVTQDTFTASLHTLGVAITGTFDLGTATPKGRSVMSAGLKELSVFQILGFSTLLNDVKYSDCMKHCPHLESVICMADKKNPWYPRISLQPTTGLHHDPFESIWHPNILFKYCHKYCLKYCFVNCF